MILIGLAFYLFATVAVLSAVMVVTARNPVHSVLFLILTFFNCAGLFVLQGAEFLAMLLVIVYVGAVAVLFMFVVMMLDSNSQVVRDGTRPYVVVGLTVGAILVAELISVTGLWVISPEAKLVIADPAPAIAEISNTKALGMLIYTKYVYLFQGAGLILLVAMIGAIVLTLRTRPGVKRQDISKQLSRKREEGVTLKSVETGSGI
ncbi:MAG: NADH-quinone oxidoreductase subunit J [Alphaproteobacteria bacterium]